jgi:hypothetical protein
MRVDFQVFPETLVTIILVSLGILVASVSGGALKKAGTMFYNPTMNSLERPSPIIKIGRVVIQFVASRMILQNLISSLREVCVRFCVRFLSFLTEYTNL